MKKCFILVIAFVAFLPVAFAQTWSVGAGYVNRQKKGHYSTEGILIGGQYEYRFNSSRWSAAAGLEYSAVKDSDSGSVHYDQRVHIPLTAGFRIISAGNINVGLYAGPAMVVGIFHRDQWPSPYYISSKVENEYWGDDNHWGAKNPLGLMACGGVTVDFSRKCRLRSGYSYALIDHTYGETHRFWDVSMFYLF